MITIYDASDGRVVYPAQSSGSSEVIRDESNTVAILIHRSGSWYYKLLHDDSGDEVLVAYGVTLHKAAQELGTLLDTNDEVRKRRNILNPVLLVKYIDE